MRRRNDRDPQFIIAEVGGKNPRVVFGPDDLGCVEAVLPDAKAREPRARFVIAAIVSEADGHVECLIDRRRIADKLRWEFQELELSALCGDKPTFRKLVTLFADADEYRKHADFYHEQTKKLEGELEALKKAAARGRRSGRKAVRG